MRGMRERRDVEHLRLAPLEQRRAVRGVEHADLGRQRPDVGRAATVDAHAFVDDAPADDFLLQRTEGLLDLTGLLGVDAGLLGRADQRDLDADEDLVELVVAVGLVGDLHRRVGVGFGVRLHRGVHGGRVVDVRHVLDRRDRAAGLDELVAQLLLQLDRGRDPLLRLFEALGDELFGHLRGALFVELPRALGATGFDHHDRDVAVVELTAGHDDLERGVVTLLERGVRDPLTVVVREAHRTDRTVERDARDGQRGRRAVDRRDVVRVLEVDTEDGGDDLDLVAEVGRERRAQRPVGEPTGEDRELAGATFTPEERTGDLARGVRPLFDVDRQREEVDALTGLRRGDGRQQRGAADLDDDCAGGKGCELAGLERHLETGGVDRTGNRNCVTHATVPLCLGERHRFPVVSVRAISDVRSRALATDNRHLLSAWLRMSNEERMTAPRANPYRRMPSLAMSARYRSTLLRRR